MTRHRAARALAMLALAAGIASAVPAQRPAPAPRDAPLLLPQMQLHDPWIVADTETRSYRLFTRNERAMTGDGRLGTMMYESRDLKHWSRPRVVFALPPGTWARGGSWAPEVHRWRGRWYLFSTFHDEAAKLAPAGGRTPYRRGTILAVADRPEGPYRLVRGGEPIVPKGQMTLDGSLFVDAAGRPWLVYAHEWLQTTVGTIEAMPLDRDLAAAGPSRLLFRADAAPWARGQQQPDGSRVWVTDGPELFRTRTGSLLMLWSSYGDDGYVQGIARSRSGGLEGPWDQLDPLVARDSGHGMVFRAFDGRLMMVVHRPFKNALGRLYELRDDGDRLQVVRQATELDLDAYPTHR